MNSRKESHIGKLKYNESIPGSLSILRNRRKQYLCTGGKCLLIQITGFLVVFFLSSNIPVGGGISESSCNTGEVGHGKNSYWTVIRNCLNVEDILGGQNELVRVLFEHTLSMEIPVGQLVSFSLGFFT